MPSKMLDAPRKYWWDHDDEGTQCKFLADQSRPEFKEKIYDISQVVCHSKEEVAE